MPATSLRGGCSKGREVSQASRQFDSLGYIVHKVAPSDSLQGLAIRYNASVQQIKQANRLLDDIALFAHTELLIPTRQLPVGSVPCRGAPGTASPTSCASAALARLRDCHGLADAPSSWEFTMAAGCHDSPAASPPRSAAASPRCSGGSDGTSAAGGADPPSPRRLKAKLARVLLQHGGGFGGSPNSSRPGSPLAEEVEMTEIHRVASGGASFGGGGPGGRGLAGADGMRHSPSSGSLQQRRSSGCGEQAAAGSGWGEDRHGIPLLTPTA